MDGSELTPATRADTMETLEADENITKAAIPPKILNQKNSAPSFKATNTAMDEETQNKILNILLAGDSYSGKTTTAL